MRGPTAFTESSSSTPVTCTLVPSVVPASSPQAAWAEVLGRRWRTRPRTRSATSAASSRANGTPIGRSRRSLGSPRARRPPTGGRRSGASQSAKVDTVLTSCTRVGSTGSGVERREQPVDAGLDDGAPGRSPATSPPSPESESPPLDHQRWRRGGPPRPGRHRRARRCDATGRAAASTAASTAAGAETPPAWPGGGAIPRGREDRIVVLAGRAEPVGRRGGIVVVHRCPALT
jgi:hypothetical protein